MFIERIPTVGWASCCYLLWDGRSGEGVIVDPSASMEEIDCALRRHNVTLTRILLTHGHFDHILTLDAVREKYHVPAAVHEADAPMLTDPLLNASAMLLYENIRAQAPQQLLHEGDSVPVGGETLSVLHTPGHSPGAVCFRFEDILLTGDTLFAGGIGRSDLPGGDGGVLRTSLKRLTSLPGETRIYPGHGGSSVLAEEIQYNPYL